MRRERWTIWRGYITFFVLVLMIATIIFFAFQATQK